MSSHSVLQDMFDADHTLADPGSAGRISPDRDQAICEIVTAGAEGRLLSDPVRSGQLLVLTAKTLGGNAIVVSDSGMNVSGQTQLTFDTAKDTCLFVGVDDGAGGYRWQVVINVNGAFS